MPLKPAQSESHPESAAAAEAAAMPAGSSATSSIWIHFLLPSVTDLLFIALLFGLSCGALGRLLLRDGDTGWHIRDGQMILQTHAIPRVDSFSATMTGHTWYAWEWLYDTLMGAIHQVFGLNGVAFYTAAIIAATFVLTFHLSLKRGGNLPITLCLLLISLGASAVHFLARPHVVSWFLSVIWFEILDSAAHGPDRRDRRLLFLPLLMVFWVNLHGGFVTGFVLLGIYLMAAALEYLRQRNQRVQIGRWLKWLGTISLLSLIASFVNPYGYRLHIHVYRYLTDRFLMSRIQEFHSPDFHGAAEQCFALLLLITIVALTTARRKPGLAPLLVILFAGCSGLYAVRNLPVSSLLITLIVAPLLTETVAEGSQNSEVPTRTRTALAWVAGFGRRLGILEAKLQGHLWLVLAFVVGMWACFNGGRIDSQQLFNAYFDGKRFPVQAAEFIAKSNNHEPIFCPDQWGGYLIYRLYPQVKVMVDDRHDLYGDEFFKDYLKAIFVQPGWNQVLDEQHVKRVLVQKDSTLGTILQQMPGWKLVYEDATAVLFERVGPTTD